MTQVLLVCEPEDPWQILAAALDGEGDIRVCGLTRGPLQAVAEAVRTEPQVAVVKADLSRDGAHQVTRLLAERVPGCQVVLVGAEPEPRRLLASLEAGVRGYLTPDHGLEELLTAIRIVHGGEVALPRTLLPKLLPALVDPRREQGNEALARLTAQERRVLLLLVQGANNEGIGLRLGISPETARTHVQHVLRKLGAHSRLEAVAFVNRAGLAEGLARLVAHDRHTEAAGGSPRQRPAG